jgi:hypothetical protein
MPAPLNGSGIANHQDGGITHRLPRRRLVNLVLAAAVSGNRG